MSDIPRTATTGAEAALPEALPEALLWIKDAPLFIDDENIARFYDAIVRPAYDETAPLRIRLSETQKKDLQAKLGGKAKIGLGGLLGGLFTAEAEASAEGQRAQSTGSALEQELTLQPISNSQRRLEQLTAYYGLLEPERLLVGGADGPLAWQKKKSAADLPRALCFIDLPPGTKFMPMAAEFENGQVVKLFEMLARAARKELPPFDRNKKVKYWRSFAGIFDAGIAVDAIESASFEHGKIEWIDFRVPLNEAGAVMHLHLEPRHRYFTGAFAYMVVRRSSGHGIRLVGTLKDGPDVNGLALYEK